MKDSIITDSLPNTGPNTKFIYLISHDEFKEHFGRNEYAN